jgi:cytoskeletal protein CcmA (bactofilin family)
MIFKKDKGDYKGAGRRLEDAFGPNITVVAPGTKILGTISGKGNLRISGKLEGKITIEGHVWVDRRCKIEGMIDARGVIIEGEVQGNIESSGKTELREEGRVIGDIRCAQISVADGSFLQGEIHMKPPTNQPQGFKPKRKEELSGRTP